MQSAMLQGLKAYSTAAARPVSISSSDVGVDIAPSGPSNGFAGLITNMANDAVAATRKSEAVSRQAVTGKADMVDVVEAVNNAEIALESVVAVRDRVVSAYQEIMRMQI